ncbi:MAG: DNA primase [Moraxella sp.]|nr:DNA primase [Moraxella sp.]
MRIPDNILERLNSQADLIAIIKKHTPLKPAGHEFKGCCPFHGEKSPSFFVNPQTNLYYCFGCGVRGNPIKFLREYERMTFQEAVEYLSDQTGIDLPKDDSTDKIRYKKSLPTPPAGMPDPPNHQPPKTPQPNHITLPHPQNEQDGDLYTLLAQICAYYQAQLKQNPTAYQYFIKRGLTDETIATFGLGYAPSDWQHLERTFAHDIEGLKILGLVRTSQKGRDFDLFRNRMIFPIKDRQGRVVGFAGRSLGDEMPKYINSSESPVFAKQHILYGLYEARLAKATRFLVVEGYMDVIALHQAGIYGAVAPMGTAVNENQITHLLKYHDTLTLCFDGDEAGQRASWRALEVSAPMLNDGKQLKFLTLADGHDPDTYVKTFGADATRQAISQAKPTSEYVYDILCSRFDVSRPEGKAQAMAQLKELTGRFPKGSSFKWWLNNDIYQKFNHKKTKTAPDTKSYIAQIDQNLQLALCLLYRPSLLQTNDISTLLSASGVDTAHALYAKRLHSTDMTAPPLPTWQDLDDEFSELVSAIGRILSHPNLPFDLADNRPSTIDQKAHFIMASLTNAELRTKLTKAWREFFHQTQHHHLDDIGLLFNELLCQAVQDAIKKASKDSQNLIISEIHKRRLQALERWDSTQKAKQASLLDKIY